MIFVIGVVIGVICMICAWLVKYARRNYGALEALGIPVVGPTFCMGSDPFGYKKIQHFEDIARMQKYGTVYGVYDGQFPQIHISDPELIKLIMVKHYDHFKDRNIADFGHPVLDESLDWLQGEKWKVVRALLSSSFSSGRVKQMSEPLRVLVDEHVLKLRQECVENGNNGQMKLDFKKWLTMVIADMVGKCYCGVQFKNHDDPDNEMCKLFRSLLGEDWQNNFATYTLPMVFPFLRRFFPLIPRHDIDKLSKLVTDLFEHRLKHKMDIQDFVGSMLSFWDRLNAPEMRRLNIGRETILAAALEFFLVSYDSAGTPIVLLVYYLATHPKTQEKVLTEIDNTVVKYKGILGHEAVVNDMPYLTACVSETYRLVPAFIRAERVCTKDWVHENDLLRIPKGITVIFPLWAVNRHPDYHENPEEFLPERFLPDSQEHKMNPYAFSTFGHGPKNCAGMKWGYQMAKLIMARFLQEFQIHARDDTILTYKPGNPFIPQYEPILIDIQTR